MDGESKKFIVAMDVFCVLMQWLTKIYLNVLAKKKRFVITHKRRIVRERIER